MQYPANHGSSVKNWPLFYPIIHHDIDGDIPESSKSLADRSYLIWKSIYYQASMSLLACSDYTRVWRQSGRRNHDAFFGSQGIFRIDGYCLCGAICGHLSLLGLCLLAHGPLPRPQVNIL